MQTTEAIGKRLQDKLPFLRGKLNALPPGSQQFSKISAIYNIIENQQNFRLNTLEKCEKVILLILQRGKRPNLDDQEESEPYPPPVESTSIQNEYKDTFASPEGDTIKSPDDYIIKSPDEVDAPNEERYESDRPSIYSVVAETIKAKVEPAIWSHAPIPVLVSQFIPSMMPTIDTSKPPISAEDLQALLQTVDEPGEDGSTPIGDEQKAASIPLVHKSKVSLVPTPFHKKSRKVVESAEGIKNESKNSVDKIKDTNKDKVKHADKTKVVDKDKVKDVDKDKVKDALKYKVKDAHKDNIKDADKNKAKDTHKDKIKDKSKDKVKVGKNKTDGGRDSKDKDNKDKHKSKSSSDIIKDKVKTGEKSDKPRTKKEHSSHSKSSPRLVESDSIFGSVLSRLDEFIGDKEKDKTKVRRDSKDGEKNDSSACGSDQKTSKESDKTDKEREREAHMSNVETKLSYLNKQMSSELRKHGLSDRERKDIRKPYMDKINKYKETLKLIRSGKLPTNEQQRKSEEKKTRAKDKDIEKEKEKDKSKSSKSSKPATVTNEDKDKYTAVVIDKERIDTAEKVNDKATDAKDEDASAKCKVATVKPMTIRKKIVDPRYEESCTSVALNDAGREPLQPPPLPLGFQGFDPFANESAEINRLRKVPPTFRQGVAGDKGQPRNPLHEVGNGHLRHLGDPRFENAPSRFMPLLPANQAPPRGRDNFAPQREFPQDYQWRQGMHPHPRQHMYGGHRQPMQCVPHDRNFQETNFRYRWEPPPNELTGQRARYPNQPGNEFHPFDPIGNNEYDLSKMQAVDFYSPNKPTIAHNYREWRKFKQAEDHVKKEAEEVRRKEADDLKRKEEEELKKKEEEELKKKEEEIKKKEDELKKKEDEELKRKEEDEELKRKEEELKKAEEELKKKEEELKKKEEEFKIKEQEELKKKEEQELKKREDELKKKEEQELKKREEEALKKMEEELKIKEAENLINKDADELRVKEDMLKKKTEIQLRNEADVSIKKEEDDLHLKEVMPANTSKKDGNIIEISDSNCDSNSSNGKGGDVKNSEMPFKTETGSTNDKSEKLAQMTEDNNDSMNREGILKMLSQAKTNAGDDGTFVPTKILDMLESFLQKQNIPAKEGSSSLPVKDENAELQVKDTAVTEETPIEPKLEIPVNNSEESTIQNVLDSTKDKQKVTNDNSQEISSTPDELMNDVNVQEKASCILQNEQSKTSLFKPLNTLDSNEVKLENKLDEMKNNVNVQDNASFLLQNDDTTSDLNEIQRKKKLDDVKNDVNVEEKIDSLHEDSLFNVSESLENNEKTPKMTKQNDTAPIGRRLRRRKSVNYNEVKISSDIEDSPKRKRKVEVKEIKKSLKDTSVLTNKEETEVAESDVILPVVEQNNEEIVPEDVKVEENIPEEEKSVPASNITLTPTKNKNKKLKKKPLAVLDVSDPKPSVLGDTTNLDKTIEGVGNGSIHVEPKVDSMLLDYLTELENEDKVKKETKVTTKDNIKKGKSDTLIRQPAKSSVSNTDASEDQQGPDDMDRIGKRRGRRSELDKLHDDIKEVLGESIMGGITRRSINNGSSRASSPGSVRSTTSSVQDNTDTKDVKISPSANEFKKWTAVRVVLKKLPATEDSVAPSSILNEIGPSPKRQRLSRSSKAVVGSYVESPTTPKSDQPQNVEEHSMQATSVKRKVLDEPSANEDQVLSKRPAMDTNKSKILPNKNYYLKFEKNDLNNCQICDFSGPLITGHYIQEHSDSDVLISRLSPEASQDAFEESVLNDYASVAVENITGGGKRFAKFDFRCRFCSHDLQKEHTAVFYDHLCSHTGEARYHCTECSFKHHAKPMVKNHMNFKHRKNQEPRIDDPPKNFDKIFGYICSDCNYLQLRKESVCEHIEKYHDKETAYVYTINMSLPILQNRQAKVRKAADVSPEPEKEEAATDDQPRERRLRSSLRLKKSEHQEKVEKCKEMSMDDESVDSGRVSTTSDVPEVVHKTPPKSAFVCDNWDEFWNNWQEPQRPASTTPKRSSSIVDELKKRLDEQNKPIQKEGLFLTPIDNEVVCSSLIPEEQTQIKECPIEPKTEKESPKKKDTTQDIDSSQEEDISEEKLEMLKDALLRPRKSTLLSIGIIDALIYDDGSVSYVCRKPSCIFNSIDSRVLEVHCTYTHFNSEEELVCNVCPMRKTEPMVEVFAHLRDHVEHYLQSKVAPPGVNIKVEPQPEQIEDIQDLTEETISPVVKEEVTSPPKMMFRIEKVESLAPPTCTSSSIAPVTTVVAEPPPLAPLTSATQSIVQTVSSSGTQNGRSSRLESTKARLPSPVPTAVTCRVFTLNSTEMKMHRKLPAVVAKWLKAGMSYLLKCPQYQCEFFTASEDMFEEHLKSHKFNDTLIPCLYCNFKMKQEFITIHLMMRHATSNFGCGHCLYRARNTEYVQIHHELSHPGKQFALRQFDQLVNRYRPPSLPLMSSILKPYKCGCGKTYYCTKNYELHKQLCLVQIGSDQVDDHFLYNCRYCVMGATSIVEVLRHSAIEHPFHDIAIIFRQHKDFIPRGREQENILQNLIILDENSFKAPNATIGSSLPSFPPPPPPPPLHIKSNPAVAVVPAPAIVTNLNQTQLVMTTDVASGSITSGTDNSMKTIMLVVAPVTAAAPVPLAVTTALPLAVTTALPLAVSSIVSTVTPIVSSVVSSEASTIVSSKIATGTLAVPVSVSSTTHVSLPQSNLPTGIQELYEEVKDALKCNNCGRVSKTTDDFLIHIRSCNLNIGVKTLTCAICKNNYKNEQGLLAHLRVHGLKNISCGLCGVKEATAVALRKHVKDEHKLMNIVLKPVDPDKSDIKVDAFIGKPVNITSKKVNVDAQGAIRDIGDGTCFGPGDLHRLPMTPIFKFMASCKICIFSTKVRSNFLRHLRLHVTGQFDSKIHVGEAVNPVPCLEKNELMFDKMTNLAASSFEGRMGPKTVSTANATSTAAPANAAASKEKISIKVPGFIPENRRYVCGATGCNYLCLEEQNLRHHLQALHDIEQTYTCVHCKEELNTKSNFLDLDAIMSHLRLHENNLYMCPYCDYLNNQSSKIDRHCVEKHADKPAKFLTLRQDADVLELPLLGEKPTKRRVWKCGICASRKCTELEIRVHVQVKHTLEAQYKCTYCQFKDDTTQTFGQHFLKKHPNLSPDIIVAYIREEKEETEEKAQVGGRFDTTPLWVKNRDTVKHIRGILLDEDNRGTTKKIAKVSPVKTLVKSPAGGIKRRASTKATEIVPSSSKQPKLAKTTPVTSPTPSTEVATIIDISDDPEDDIEVVGPSDDPTDPSEECLRTMPINVLIKRDFVSTYGPLGRPADVQFACPLCNLSDFGDEESFQHHLCEEIKYKRFACAICSEKTTSFERMKNHYTAKHVTLCEMDAVKHLPKNSSIELWLKKVLIVQMRIILHNKKVMNTKAWYKCARCFHRTGTQSEAIAHARAAHKDQEIKVLKVARNVRKSNVLTP